MGKPFVSVPIRFKPKTYVRHITSGKVYEIIYGPDGPLACRIEKDNIPAYAYRRVRYKDEFVSATERAVLWVRAASIMEKNFVAAPEINYVDIYGKE